MKDLDEVLEMDTDGKVNWLVAKTHQIDTRLDDMAHNHLVHIESGLADVKKRLYIISGIIVTVLTGQNYVGIG